MNIEQLNYRVDVNRLKEHLIQEVLPLPGFIGSVFSGWSVLSSDGSCEDGFQNGSALYIERGGVRVPDIEAMKLAGVKPNEAYRIPTEICTGYLKEVMDQIEALGFYPCRARITKLAAKTRLDWHRDGHDGEYAARLHIPIITNPQVIFETEEGPSHLEADGSAYLLRVNRMHRVLNDGDDPRYHLIMNIFDTQHRSMHHRYNGPARRK